PTEDMIRKLALAVLIVLVVIGGLAAVKVTQFRTLMAGAKAFTAPPESVSSFEARQEKWQTALSAIGSITAVQGVTVTPDIPGTVREIDFESGAVVAKGDLLVRLDISSEEAQLRAAEAQLEWSRINLDRIKKLRTEDTVSASDLDSADAAMKQNL